MSQPARAQSSGSGRSVFFGFLPWIVFAVVAGPSTWEYAALAALVASLVLAAPDFRRGAPKLLDVVGIVFFAVLAALALVLGRSQLDWLERYATVVSGGVLTLTALGSLAFVPFTEQYARESTPRSIWGTPAFKRVNRVLTTVWGAAFLVSTVSAVMALQVHSGRDWFNWIIPVAALAIAVKVTAWYPDHVRAQVRERGTDEFRGPPRSTPAVTE